MEYPKTIDNNTKAFTIVELIVSILISVILLGGIFYFLSDTILGIARASSQSKFLKDFYSFTTILDTWNTEILHDYGAGSFDVAILKSIDDSSWVLIGVIDKDTMRLSALSKAWTYHNTLLWYRSLSASEIAAISGDGSIVYSYDFFPDKLFYNFNISEFQLQEYNSWNTMEMMLSIFTEYKKNLEGEDISLIPQNEVFDYSIVF